MEHTAVKTRINQSNSNLPDQLADREMAKRISAIEPALGRMYMRLAGISRKTAYTGVLRHLTACRSINHPPEKNAIREILEDAAAGRNFFGTVSDDSRGFSKIPNK